MSSVAKDEPISDEGIILRTFPHGESNLVLRVLTPTLGKIAIYARNARTSKKRFSSNPETFDNGTFTFVSGRGSMPNLETFRPAKVFRNLRTDFEKLSTASLLCEAFDNVNLEEQAGGQQSQDTYEALLLGLQALDQASEKKEIFKICFLTLSGLLLNAGFLDPKVVEQPTRNNLLKLIDRVENSCERQLVSRGVFEQLLSKVKEKKAANG